MGMPATNKQVTVGGINILKFRNCKIAENLPEYDKLGMMQQLGLIPA
jgi:predicted ester cyclase